MNQGSFQKILSFALILGWAALASCVEVPPGQNTNPAAANRNADAARAGNGSSPPASPSPSQENTAQSPAATETPDIVTAVTPSPTLTPPANAAPRIIPPSDDYSVVAVEKLVIPVAGIKREQLEDTFKNARSEGRAHDAIDIIAPKGTPVIAAADGEIARFFDSEKGGITIYQFSRDKKLVYYYAHLERRAEGIQPGQFVRQGTVIGYVGDTGNSGAGNFHLHFAIWAVDDPKRFWNGTNINPYPLLQR
jgi:murein DD-endopeptidase MepM/ murein hydrolase activator NlpD